MRSVNMFIAAVLLITALTPSARAAQSGGEAGAPQATIAVQIEGATRHQTIEGFGVNANSRSWDLANPGGLTAQLDTLIDETGATIWRVLVESHEDWETTNDNADPAVFNAAYYNSLYETDKFKRLWAMMAYLEGRGVPTIYLSVMGCVPAWMGGCTLPADGSRDDEWVEMMASMVSYARTTKGLRIDLFNPINEQDSDLGTSQEGPRITPAHYVRIMKKLSARLDALGLGDLRLAGPDIAKMQNAGPYLSAMAAEPALVAKFSHFAGHRYDAGDGGLTGAIAGSAFPDLKPWITEYSGVCASFACDSGAQVPADEEWQFTIDTFDYLLSYLDDGVTAALAWDAYDSYYEHHETYTYWGLISYDTGTGAYAPTKRLSVARHAYRFIPAGMERIDASSGAPGAVSVSAFHDSGTGQLTLIGRNRTGSPQTLSVSLAGVGAPGVLRLYETTRDIDWRDSGGVTPSGGSYSVSLAADSMFTLTNVPPTPPARQYKYKILLPLLIR